MNSRLNLPSPENGDVFLCADKFESDQEKRVSMALVYTCHLGKPKVWNAFPIHRARELRTYSWLKTCCQESCCNGKGYPDFVDKDHLPPTTTEYHIAHIHLFSHNDNTVHPLEIASVWIALLLGILGVVLAARNLWRHFHTSPLLRRLMQYAEGPAYETTVAADGTIVPAVHYFDLEGAREIMSRDKKKKRETRRRLDNYKERRHKSAVAVHNDVAAMTSLQMLEMEIEFINCDAEDGQKIISDDKSQEEIIIDEILSMPIDSLLTVPKVPDRLLSPLVTNPRRIQHSLETTSDSGQDQRPRRSSSTDPSRPNIDILLPSPLTPPYLPTKPVSSVWSARHTTNRLYRYTHFERIVYPHQRVIVPPAFVH